MELEEDEEEVGTALGQVPSRQAPSCVSESARHLLAGWLAGRSDWLAWRDSSIESERESEKDGSVEFGNQANHWLKLNSMLFAPPQWPPSGLSISIPISLSTLEAAAGQADGSWPSLGSFRSAGRSRVVSTSQQANKPTSRRADRPTRPSARRAYEQTADLANGNRWRPSELSERDRFREHSP